MSSNIYKNKINYLKTKIQDQYYYHPSDSRVVSNIDIKKKIRDIFSDKNFIYKINCIVNYKNNTKSKEVIVAHMDNYLLTLDNKKISIQDIYDINKDH